MGKVRIGGDTSGTPELGAPFAIGASIGYATTTVATLGIELLYTHAAEGFCGPSVSLEFENKSVVTFFHNISYQLPILQLS
jgi:hypothetical protein